MYRKGFWLILIESDGAELAVACQILSRENETLHLRAHVPPTWYPQSFTSYKVRQNGEILGWRRLPVEAPIEVPAHAGLYSIDLDFPLDSARHGEAAGDRQPVYSAPSP
jgi:hypothetical protein